VSPDDGDSIPRAHGGSPASTATGTPASEPPGQIRRFVSRWGFPLFVLIVLVLGRSVLLPFVFGGLIAYILAPVVRWMSERRNGTRRMPRGLAIIICYIVFLAAVTGFMFLLVPRLSSDIARLGKSVPGLYARINDEWTPEMARWLEKKFPTLATSRVEPEEQKVVSDVPLPPDTALTMTPLPDGRFAVSLAPGGVDIRAADNGGYHLQPRELAPAPQSLEDKLREFTHRSLVGMQSQVNDVLRAGQEFVADFIRGIFLFFFTLMIGAFMLIDMEKVHAFLRSLFPSNVREDYDVIIAGIDEGMSGVIRGQLVICLVNCVLSYIGLLVFGVNYALILAIVAGLMSLIPIFGSIMSSVPIVLVALVSGADGIDVFRGLGMLLWIIGIHFVEANVLNPKIIGSAAKIHPVLVIFALFFGEASFGLVGALFAVPVLSAIQVVFMYFYRKTWKDAGRTGPVKRPDVAPPR
jgi:predicted PurR-regulated permease PerM